MTTSLVIRPPHRLEDARLPRHTHALFLAGAIDTLNTAESWRDTLRRICERRSGRVWIDPRAPDYDAARPAALTRQLAWERHHQEQAHALVFWFDGPSACPMSLFELGRWLHHPTKPLFIGIAPGWPRGAEVRTHARLARPNHPIAHSLDDLASALDAARW